MLPKITSLLQSKRNLYHFVKHTHKFLYRMKFSTKYVFRLFSKLKIWEKYVAWVCARVSAVMVRVYYDYACMCMRMYLLCGWQIYEFYPKMEFCYRFIIARTPSLTNKLKAKKKNKKTAASDPYSTIVIYEFRTLFYTKLLCLRMNEPANNNWNFGFCQN